MTVSIIVLMGQNIKWDTTRMLWGSTQERVSEAEEHVLILRLVPHLCILKHFLFIEPD